MTDENTRFVRAHDGDHVVQCHIEARGAGKEAADYLVVQDARGGAATWLHPDRDAGEIARLADAHPDVEGLFGSPQANGEDAQWLHHPDDYRDENRRGDHHEGDHHEGDQS